MPDKDKEEDSIGIEDAGVKRLPTVMCPRCNKPMGVKRKRDKEEKTGFLDLKKSKVTIVDFECPDCGSSWTEEIEREDKGCFVATASLGSPLHPKLDVLRKFRDQELNESFFGEKFVEFYYKISPPIAKLISKSEKLRNISRKIFVKPLVEALEELDEF